MNDGEDTRVRSLIPVPYDQFHEPALLTSIDDILKFDAAIRAITEDLPKPIRLGSPLRAWEGSWHRWGIAITDENKAELIRRANEFYQTDDMECRPDTAERDALRDFKRGIAQGIMQQMQAQLANIVKEMMRVVDDGRQVFNIADIATGIGRDSAAIVTALKGDPATEGLLKRTVFHLVDYSDRLALAEKNLRELQVATVPHAMSDERFLAETADGKGDKLDFIVMSSHLHKKAALSSYLTDIRGSLSGKGVFISADWHSPMLQYPSEVCEILEDLGVDRNKLDEFHWLLGPLMHEAVQENATPEELKALQDHHAHWKNLAGEVGDRKYGSALKLRIINAFTTTKQLGQELERAGFETERGKIGGAFPRAVLPEKLPLQVKARADTAAVTIALKR